MFIFYSQKDVASQMPTILGISVDPRNAKVVKTADAADPIKEVCFVVPRVKPAGTKNWVFLPDQYTWQGYDEGLMIPKAASFPAIGDKLLVSTDMCVYNYDTDVTGTSFVENGAPIVVIGKHGVCFLCNAQNYVMFGHCPPTMTNEDPDFIASIGERRWNQIKGLGTWSKVLEYRSAEGRVYVKGVASAPANWKINTPSMLPTGSVGKTYAKVGSDTTFYDNSAQYQVGSTSRYTYNYFYFTDIEKTVNKIPGELMQDSILTGSTNVPVGNYVVR